MEFMRRKTTNRKREKIINDNLKMVKLIFFNWTNRILPTSDVFLFYFFNAAKESLKLVSVV